MGWRKFSRFAGIGAAGLLTACGGSPQTAPPVASSAPSATPEAPSHNWLTQEGQEYGYAAALSKEQQDAGQAAENVVMFRYLGEKDGVYSVATVDNGVMTIGSCANPCQVVKLANSMGGEQRMVFNPQTIIGLALTDAFNGQLKPYQPAEMSLPAAPPAASAAPVSAAPEANADNAATP